MLNSLFATASQKILTAENPVRRISFRWAIALTPLLGIIALSPPPAFAQVWDQSSRYSRDLTAQLPTLPTSPLPTSPLPGLPTSSPLPAVITNDTLLDALPDETVLSPAVSTNNILLQSLPPETIVLPGVSQADIDRVLTQSNQPSTRRDSALVPSTVGDGSSGIGRSLTTCRYSPSAGSANPLGENVQVIVTEVASSFSENTIFSYQQLADLSSNAGTEPVVVAERSFILFNTSLAQARRELAGSRERYARFLGLPTNSTLVKSGFGAINQRLVCDRND